MRCDRYDSVTRASRQTGRLESAAAHVCLCRVTSDDELHEGTQIGGSDCGTGQDVGVADVGGVSFSCMHVQ